MVTATPPAPAPAPSTADGDAVTHFRKAARRILENKFGAQWALFDEARLPEIALQTARDLQAAKPADDVFFGALVVAVQSVAHGLLASGRRQAAPAPASHQQARASIGQQLSQGQKRPAVRAEVLRGWREYGKWAEFIGTGHKLLPLMTAEELEMAAEDHERPARTELATAAMLRAIADGLQPGQQVKDHYTPDDLDALYHRFLG